MSSDTRIYALKSQGGAVVALVRAVNRNQALAHQARSTWATAVATPDELIAATKADIAVEEARPETASATEELGL